MTMRVVSQFPEDVNDGLRALAPHAEIVTIASGPPRALPPDSRVMIAVPDMDKLGDFPPRPDGWPFGLECLQLVSVGIDLYPDWYRDVPAIAGAKGVGAVPLAEFALAAILAAAKRFPEAWIDRREDWRVDRGRLVSGGTLGIFGYGAIGRALAPRALALGMKVIALRRSAGPFDLPAVEHAADIVDLFARSDHVVLAAPATPETAGIVGRKALAAARPGLHLVNIARGSLIDDDALLEALDDGRVARATLDVTQPEPLPAGHPYYTHPRVFLSPHVANRTETSRSALLDRAAENLHRLARGEPLVGVIDPVLGY
jgi:phosphoglycerate dehydrogenase-like enzyme